MWITDTSRRRVGDVRRVSHEEALHLLDREHDRQSLYALQPGGSYMVDSEGDHWQRIC